MLFVTTVDFIAVKAGVKHNAVILTPSKKKIPFGEAGDLYRRN